MVFRVGGTGLPAHLWAAASGAPEDAGDAMRDAIYILVTVAFYGLMIGYVEWCKRLGQDGEGEDRP